MRVTKIFRVMFVFAFNVCLLFTVKPPLIRYSGIKFPFAVDAYSVIRQYLSTTKHR